MIKVLEVNNVDLFGKCFNGYDMINSLSSKDLEIKQAVIDKESDNPNVIKILDNKDKLECNKNIFNFEYSTSIKNVISITSPSLMNLKEYKEADIIHFHLFHNTNLSLYSLKKIAEEKKVVISLHDPWFLTGRCVHFFECDKWKSGCDKCPNLNTTFPFIKDNCHDMWELKKMVFQDLDIDIVCVSPWIYDLTKESPILNGNNHIHNIPLGIDDNTFSKVTRKEAREKYGFTNDEVVIFLRSQNAFKGTSYVKEALKKLDINKNIVILTCDNKGLLDELKDKYKVIDLGVIKDDEMAYAMNSCDIFLMPSLGETFGIMAVEAMICGKPVVVFNNTALPIITKAPECGYLVNNKDSTDLCRAIKELVLNEEERTRRGNLGKKIAKECYSISKYHKSLKNLYLEVYNRKHNIIKESSNYEINDNIKQFRFYLNYFTIINFGLNKYGKSLMYNLNGIRRNYDYKINYADKALQEEIFKYMLKLEEILRIEGHIEKNYIRKQLAKLFYVLVKDPRYLAVKVQK